jgi:hypothetical protein
MEPPQVAALVHARQLHEAALERMRTVLQSRQVDRTVSRECLKFMAFVDANGLKSGNTYMNRLAVDSYFTRMVVNRNGQKNTINRIVSSLQYFEDSVENPNRIPRFVVRNVTVENAVKAQQLQFQASAQGINLGADPHKGLKDLMPQSDKKKIMTYIYESRPDWGPCGMCFSWGTNSGIRGASQRKLVKCDINMSRGFGVEKEGPRSRTLLLVMRRGKGHKDNFTTDKQVAVWRHVDYQLCSVFASALHLINDLSRDFAINFLHTDKTKRASWWDSPLIDYDTYSEESSAMKQVYDGTGVESCKLTHHRTQMVQQAGSEGLAPYQINTLTKHMLEKIHSAYQSECDKETLKVMGGQGRDESRFVEREYLDAADYAFTVMEYTSFLLPNYNNWIQQSQSANGDKSSCCRKFLFEIIPYLVEVLVQDGIFFIMDFPHHPMSHLLKVRIVFLLFLKNHSYISNYHCYISNYLTTLLFLTT